MLVCAVAYGIFLVRHVSPHAGGSDPSGYLNSARLMSRGEWLTSPRVLPGYSSEEFGPRSLVPLGFLMRLDGRMAPTYPTGYPLQLLAAAGFGWSHAVAVVNVITALASGFLLFAFCRKLGLSCGLSFGGVVLLCLCPLFLYAVFLPMSDLSALAWSLAVCYWALGARENWKYGLCCGAAMGIAVLVRPTNLLLVLPLFAALGFRLRPWLAVALGGLPAAAFFCFYNWRVYGSPWVTGYTEVWSIFQTDYLPHNLTHFSRWIFFLLSPLILVSAAAPFVEAGRQRGLAVLAVWATALIGFYAFYYHAGETWWYLRFILPAFPALIVAALVVLETVWRNAKARSGLVAAALTVLLLLAAGWQVGQIRQLTVLQLEPGERSYHDAARWAQKNLPARSVIFCMQVSGAFFYYTDFLLLRWDLVAPEKFGPLFDVVGRQDRPVYIALFDYETVQAQTLIGGHWTQLATVGQVTFWQRQP
jgi:hypothetical protein